MPGRIISAIDFAASVVLQGLVLAYRYLLSPMTGPSCRHGPSCSAYALESLKRHGAWYGVWLTAARFSRCHPWGSHGFDPVPKELPPHASLMPWRVGRWFTAGERMPSSSPSPTPTHSRDPS